MKEIIIDINKDEALQIRRGESIKAQVGDHIIIIKGPTKLIKNKHKEDKKYGKIS